MMPTEAPPPPFCTAPSWAQDMGQADVPNLTWTIVESSNNGIKIRPLEDF